MKVVCVISSIGGGSAGEGGWRGRGRGLGWMEVRKKGGRGRGLGEREGGGLAVYSNILICFFV